MRIYVDAEIGPATLADELYESLSWSEQAEFIIAVIKGLDPEVIRGVGRYITEALEEF